jgi:hypothetical protein
MNSATLYDHAEWAEGPHRIRLTLLTMNSATLATTLNGLKALGVTCGFGAMALTYVANHDVVNWCDKHQPHEETPCAGFDDWTLFYVAAALYGFMDCSFQSVCGALCASSFNSTGNAPDAWALFRTFQAVGAAVGFFISTPLSINGGHTSSESQLMTELIITGALMCVVLQLCAYTGKPVSLEVGWVSIGVLPCCWMRTCAYQTRSLTDATFCASL